MIVRFLMTSYVALVLTTWSAAAGLIPRHEHPARMASLRERALSRLPGVIADELRQRDPSTYDLPLDDVIAEESGLVKRQGGNVYSKCTGNVVAATYDDGVGVNHKNFTDLWKAAGHTLTYFINLRNSACSYDEPGASAVRYSLDAGMTICSHTATHKDLTKVSHAEMEQEIERVETFTWKVLGLVPNCFRPPYLSTNGEINSYLSGKGYKSIVQVSLDSQDWQVADTNPQQSIQDWGKVQKGDIILQHETHVNDLTKIGPAAIDILQKQNLKSVGIAECLGLSAAYKAFDKTQRKARDSTWTC